MTMGYIEFFYKKFPGEFACFRGGAVKWIPSHLLGGDVALGQHEGGWGCLEATSQWGEGVIFIEITFRRIVKKSVRGGGSA